MGPLHPVPKPDGAELPTAPLIEFVGVSKQYGVRRGLRDATFQLPAHRIIGVVGENGSGKSTMLKLIAGHLYPSRGDVRIGGEKVQGRMGERVAFLSDAETSYPFFTVAEMVVYTQTLFWDFQRGRAEDLLDFLGVDRSARLGALSKGGRSRVKLALTVARDAEIIVADEPLSGLDPLVRQAIIRGFIRFVDLERQTVVLSTHEVAEVEPLLDTAVLIDQGHVRAVESLEAIESRGYSEGMVGWMKSLLVGDGTNPSVG